LSPAAPAPQPAQPLSRPAPQPAQPAPQPEPRPVVQAEPPKPQPASPAEPQSAPRTETPRPRQARTPLVSLSELMGGGRPAEEPSAHEAQLQEQVDEQCEQKLHQARAALLEAIREMRPRFAAVFSEMRFSENRVAITVPTSELREEILRSRTELLGRLMEVADVKCPLELEITLNEQMRPSLPIRLEDRLGYLSERSADLQALRVALSLEAES